MKKIHLDQQIETDLTRSIQTFIQKQTDCELTEQQAANLLHFLINRIGDALYSQLLFENRIGILQKLCEIMGIEKKAVH